MSDALLTTEDVAGLLRVHPKQVYRLLRRGLPGRKVGGEWRFVRAEVLAWAGAPSAGEGEGSAGPREAPGPTAAPSERSAPPLVAANGDVACELLLGLANAGAPLLGFVEADRARALAWLGARAVLAAGCHGAGFPAHLGPDRLARIHLVAREVGLCARGCAPAVAELGGRVLAGRPATAGIAVHLERAAAEAGVKPTVRPLGSHREVALAVLRGEAEVGLLTRAWAARVGLAFRALAVEDYGLVVRAVDLGHPALVRLCETAQGGAYQRALAAVPGYDAAAAGAIRYDAA